MKHLYRTFALAVCLLSTCFTCVAGVDDIVPRLLQVPDDLAEEKVVALNQRRTELLKERSALKKLIKDHDAKDVTKGTQEEKQKYNEEGATLDRLKLAHIEATNKFNRDVERAAGAAGLRQLDQRWEVARSRVQAKAAWILGVYLMRHGKTDQAIPYLKEARQFYRDPDSRENELLNRFIYDPREHQEMRREALWIEEVVPPYESRASAILDAMDYGRGNWEKSIQYLESARQADPQNLVVRDALNYLQGIAAADQR